MNSFVRRLLGVAKISGSSKLRGGGGQLGVHAGFDRRRLVQRCHECRCGWPDQHSRVADDSRRGLHRLGIVVCSDLRRGPLATNAFYRSELGPIASFDGSRDVSGSDRCARHFSGAAGPDRVPRIHLDPCRVGGGSASSARILRHRPGTGCSYRRMGVYAGLLLALFSVE